MRNFLLLFAVLSPWILSAQTFTSGPGDSINRIDINGKRQGHWIIYGSKNQYPAYKTSEKAAEGNFSDSKKSGLWIEYYPGGIKKSEMYFVNGRPDGHCIIYFENGNKNEEGTWKGTRWCCGTYTLYYEDGTKRQVFNFNVLGQRDSLQFYYHPNGQLASVKMFRNGKENGSTIEYDANGILHTSCTYKDGHLDGWFYEYDTTGRMVSQQFFQNGDEEISQRRLYPGTSVTSDQPAREARGIPKGNGTIAIEIEPREGGKQDSAFQYEYWPNGKIKKETLLLNGKPTGEIREFDENGICMAVFHQYRLIEGKQWIYNSDGQLVRIAYYKDGKYIGDDPLPEAAIVKKEETDSLFKAEEAARKAAYESLHCRCDTVIQSRNINEKWNGEGYRMLMKNGQVTQQGCFHLFKLIDGIYCIYDEEGRLVKIKKYKQGKYIGDAPCPGMH